jgi:hypothetical protein
MLSSWKRYKWRIVVAAIAGVLVVLRLVTWLAWLGQPPDVREYAAVQGEWQSTQPPLSPTVKEKLSRRWIEIARRYPGTVGGLSAVIAAAANPDTSAGREARQELTQQMAAANLDTIAQALDSVGGRLGTLEPFAPAILTHARQELEHPRTGRLLAAVCTITEPATRESAEPSPLYTEAADLIPDRYPGSPDIGHFCEGLGVLSNGTQPWAPRFERHLRAILTANRGRRGRAWFLVSSGLSETTNNVSPSLTPLMPPRSESVPALLGLFHPVFGVVEEFHWLPKDELVEAIIRDDASDLFIVGSADMKAKTLILLRGDITSLIVPFSLFSKAGNGTAPDFPKLRLTDYGRTVALGNYESAADAILYEVDLEYRRKLKKQRRQSEQTFGAALMRLRKQRRLKPNDFTPISAKEIARLERNELEKPHAKTLEVLATRLGVRPEEIAHYESSSSA